MADSDEVWAWELLGDANARAVQALVRPMLNEPQNSYGDWLDAPDAYGSMTYVRPPARDPVPSNQAVGIDLGSFVPPLILGAVLVGVPALFAIWAITRR